MTAIRCRLGLISLLAAAALVAAACGGGEASAPKPEGATSSGTRDAVEDSAEPDARESAALAQEAMDVYSAGDLEGFLDYFAEDAVFFGVPFEDESTAIRDIVAFYVAVGQAGTSECEGAKPVRCHFVGLDHLGGPAGVEFDMTFGFFVEDSKITEETYLGGDDATNALVNQIAPWIKNNRPKVWASTFQEGCSTATEARPGVGARTAGKPTPPSRWGLTAA